MNSQTVKEGEKKLAALKSQGTPVYTVEEARKSNAIVLRAYGRRWVPTDGEHFEVDPTLAVCRGYKRSEKSNGIELFMHSSISGWDFFPVEPFATLPDVKEEREILLASPINSALTMYGDGLDRAKILREAKDFTVSVQHLHGPTWVSKEDGSRQRVPDAADKPIREPMDYFLVVANTK